MTKRGNNENPHLPKDACQRCEAFGQDLRGRTCKACKGTGKKPERKPKQWVMWAIKVPGHKKPLMHDTKTEAMAVADSYGWPVSAISETLVTEVKP